MAKQTKKLEDLRDSTLLYDKNPPKFGYMIFWMLVILVVLAVIWSIKTPKTYIVAAAGTVESTNKNYIMSSYSGEITDMNMSEGMYVESGDALFTVYSADLDLQMNQLENQKSTYEEQISQYTKLVQSIQDDTNHFSASSSDDTLYYNQYEAYKSQVAEATVDTTMYASYGYTDEQIEAALSTNQSKISQIYYTAIQTAESSKAEAEQQLDAINGQLDALSTGEAAYTITANATGRIHMMADYKDGMVVEGGSAIASIASEQDEYEIQAKVGIADAARIHEGDSVKIAVSGLNQTVYGTITGTIGTIDSDVTVSTTENGSDYFNITVQPDSTYVVSKNGDKVNFSNGMSVEARVQYDKVSYFNYMLEALGVLTR